MDRFRATGGRLSPQPPPKDYTKEEEEAELRGLLVLPKYNHTAKHAVNRVCDKLGLKCGVYDNYYRNPQILLCNLEKDNRRLQRRVQRLEAENATLSKGKGKAVDTDNNNDDDDESDNDDANEDSDDENDDQDVDRGYNKHANEDDDEDGYEYKQEPDNDDAKESGSPMDLQIPKQFSYDNALKYLGVDERTAFSKIRSETERKYDLAKREGWVSTFNATEEAYLVIATHLDMPLSFRAVAEHVGGSGAYIKPEYDDKTILPDDEETDGHVVEASCPQATSEFERKKSSISSSSWTYGNSPKPSRQASTDAGGTRKHSRSSPRDVRPSSPPSVRSHSSKRLKRNGEKSWKKASPHHQASEPKDANAESSVRRSNTAERSIFVDPSQHRTTQSTSSSSSPSSNPPSNALGSTFGTLPSSGSWTDEKDTH